MKNFKLGFLVLLICLLFTACSETTDKKETQAKKPEADISIKESKFSNFEKELIGAYAQNNIPYQVLIHNKKAKKLTIAIDKYNNGKFIKTISESSTSLDANDKRHPINLIFSRKEIDEKHEQWINIIFFKNGNLVSTTDPLPIKASENSIMAYGPVHLPLTMQLGESKIIGSFAQTGQDGSWVQAEINTKKDIQRATNYEEAYLVRFETK